MDSNDNIEKEKVINDNNKIKENSSRAFNKDNLIIFNFLKTKKGQWIIVSIFLLLIIITGLWIRVQNLDLLKDSTTGDYIPLALDPYYFLRVAEAIADNNWKIPEKDIMRQPYEPPYTKEILPYLTIGIYKISNYFGGNISIAYAHLIYPVIFFVLGLLSFFFLILVLTNSKLIAIISSMLLAIIPSYLYRTLAGFSDHEAVGIFSFFLLLLVFSFELKNFKKIVNKKNFLINLILLSLLLGFVTVFTTLSWGGIARFVFMIVPFSFLLFWILKINNKKEYTKEFKKELFNYLLFYTIWIFSTLFISEIFGKGFNHMFKVYMISSTGILTLFTLGFILFDYLLIYYDNKIKNKKIKDNRIVLSVILTIIIGIIGLIIIGNDIGALLKGVVERLLDPFGTDRLGLTVAENKQPYLTDWISQSGKIIFYLFLSGAIFLGFNISKGIKKLENKALFIISHISLLFGILFSRISPSSLFNGENFISGFVYFISLLFYFSSFLYIYYKKDIKIKIENIILFSWLFFMLIAGRGAIRLFFVITPFFCFMAGYGIVNFFNYAKRSKEEVLKYSFYILGFIFIILLLINITNLYNSSLNQAKYTGPSANLQWQEAMSWIRENTIKNGIFVHWWDYGYWVEYLGKRAVLSDGGHFEGTFRDHLIGRYVLTTPNPNFLISFMKSNNANYLLIDQTDIGKYTAYSSIGSNSNWDRVAGISFMNLDEKSTKETSNSTIMLYQGGYGVEDDIIYKENNKSEIFLPGAIYDKFGVPNYKSYIGGIILEQETKNNTFKSPKGIFIYNEKRYDIPLRYLYINNEYLDFKIGLNATAFVIPKIDNSNQGAKINPIGTLAYLSPRVMHSTISQLYLMNDPLNKYKGMELIHTEQSSLIKELKSQNIVLGDFVYYKGIQGPIKIWELNYSNIENIKINEEFKEKELNEWAEFDNLEILI
jgi:asparagine N-glycosylation enzyme membrane subunit Stt3